MQVLRNSHLAHTCFNCLRVPIYRLYAAQAALRPLDNTTPTSTSSATLISNGQSSDEPTPLVRKQKRTLKASNTRKKAKKEPEEIPRRDPLEPTKVDKYLASLAAAGLEPTLNDLERLRPLRIPNPDSKKFVEEYNRLVDVLCRSFSKEQLRNLIGLYDSETKWTGKHKRKVDFAEAILERGWHWPSLKALEKAKRDRTEVSARCTLKFYYFRYCALTFFFYCLAYPVSPSQLFLILGKGEKILSRFVDCPCIHLWEYRWIRFTEPINDLQCSHFACG